MNIVAIVGEEKHRYQAEKNFTTGPGVDLVKSFDTYRSLISEIKRDEHFFKTIVLCLPNADYHAIRKELHSLEPKAHITNYL